MTILKTPLYAWPRISEGQTGHAKKGSVYPFTKGTEGFSTDVKSWVELCAPVKTVVNLIGPKAGNIVPMIAKDLASPAAEAERKLLPKDDYVHPYYKNTVSPECVEMIHKKGLRAQKEYAHQLALTNTIDIAVTWKCDKATDSGDYLDKRFIMAPENEANALRGAWKARYKNLDWDREHYHRPSEEKEDEPTVHYPEPSRRGGFYTCVTNDLFEKLTNLPPHLGIEVAVIVAPKRMNDADEKEMKHYHAGRRHHEETLQMDAQMNADKEHETRKNNTYANAFKDSKHKYLELGIYLD